jgi:polyhydroxybutyrate depolymerase
MNGCSEDGPGQGDAFIATDYAPIEAGVGTSDASTANEAAVDASAPSMDGAAAPLDAAPISIDASGDAGSSSLVDATEASSDASVGDGASPAVMQPIPAPIADDCITKVVAGDHKFTCNGVTYLVLVDEKCTKFACGLIFDIHGATMSGLQMRDNTLLHKLAPSKGYIVVHPSATASNTGGTWDLTNDPPKVGDFFSRMIKAFHVDPARIHVTGFSQGGIMTFWFLKNKTADLASAAPVAGAQPADWFTDAWKPRVPFLVMNGISDTASTIEGSRALIDSIVKGLNLMGGTQIAGDGHYTRKRWTGDMNMELEYIEHDYGGQPVLGGHCIPGGVDLPSGGPNNFGLNGTTCATGMIKINWGEIVLKWFMDHPKHP